MWADLALNSIGIRNEVSHKGEHLCKQVVGYDANSLCRQAITQNNNFTKHIRYSSESIQWLDHFRNGNIVHAVNSIHGGGGCGLKSNL